MSTALFLIIIALMILDVSLSLLASRIESPKELELLDEDADDLPFGPAPKNQD